MVIIVDHIDDDDDSGDDDDDGDGDGDDDDDVCHAWGWYLLAHLPDTRIALSVLSPTAVHSYMHSYAMLYYTAWYIMHYALYNLLYKKSRGSLRMTRTMKLFPGLFLASQDDLEVIVEWSLTHSLTYWMIVSNDLTDVSDDT